jgi:hypothetical protein
MPGVHVRLMVHGFSMPGVHVRLMVHGFSMPGVHVWFMVHGCAARELLVTEFLLLSAPSK